MNAHTPAETPFPLRGAIATRGKPRALRYALPVLGAALMAVSAKIQVPMLPVPMTMQTFAVLVVAMALGVRMGVTSVGLYLAAGIFGLPVFAGGGGAAYLLGPTGGYLIGFAAAAFAVAALAECGWDRRFTTTVAANGIGTVIIFATGWAWLACVLTLTTREARPLETAFATGVLPFLFGALVKILLAGAVLPLAWKFTGRRGR